MKRRKERPEQQKIDTSGGGALTSNPFSKLGALRERLPEGEAPAVRAPGPGETEAGAASGASTSPRAVVRYERKGRGGKEVTVVERLSTDPAELDAYLVELKRTLGCGGHREGEALVLQGDQRERLSRWLEARGRG